MRLLPLLVLAVLTACGGGSPVELPRPDRGAAGGGAMASAAVDSVYAEGERLFRTGKWRQALERFTQAGPLLLPEDPRHLRAQFYSAEVHYALSEYLQAVRLFRRIADENPEHPLAPDALFRAGMAYRQLWRKPQLDPTYGETAQLVFAEVVGRYPGTPAAARAAAAAGELQEWFAEKAFRNARFYLRYKAWDSAILVLRDIVANYPRTTVATRALVAMVDAYVALGYEEDRQETCEYIRQYYPQALGAARRCPAPPPAPGSQ